MEGIAFLVLARPRPGTMKQFHWNNNAKSGNLH